MMKTRRRREVMKRPSHVWFLLLALIQIYTPTSAVNTTRTTITSPLNPAALIYHTRPSDITVALGDPAVFRCGVPETSPNLTFTLYGGHGNYSLTCPQGHVEDIPQALYGHCEIKSGVSLAVWTIKGTSIPDNGTRVICQQSNNPEKHSAVLHLYDNGLNRAILLGCVLGGFFGTALLALLTVLTLQRSETFNRCLGRGDAEDDVNTIVTKE
ncbi:uncharacterized protein LOC141801137 [Halichoeres trimaculatus]|uniref:uncharacterized protein LOC141801137 n=1 Tax=Halichoeres trimaculatus TaxID=147232 RepID=UPI003D9E85BA